MADLAAGNIVETVAWFCVGLCTLAVVGRSIFKARLIRHVGADDVFIWAGLVCFIGQCIAVQIQVDHGLGENSKEVTLEMAEGEMKGEYANYLLYMPVIAFAKLSVVSVLRKCALNKKDRLLLYLFEWFLAVWAGTSEVVRAFACEMPTPWDYVEKSCINRQAWVVYFELINIVTEFVLIIMPALNISRMSISLDRKILAISFFSARIAIVPASLARIVYWLEGSTSKNAMYDLYPFAISTVAVAALEILAACVLYMRSLFEILETGFSTSPPTSPARLDTTPSFGLYSKGTWPFTHVSTVDEHLTGRPGGYEAKISATFYDEERSPAGSREHIHVSQQVDIRMSYPRAALTNYYDRARAPSVHTDSSASEHAVLDSRASELAIQRGAFLAS